VLGIAYEPGDSAAEIRTSVSTLIYIIYKVYSGIPNVTVCRVLRKRLDSRRRTMESLHAFKRKRFRNSPHSNIWNTIV
jgi:hypothetical protein